MQSTTKILLTAFVLLVLGWALQEWRPGLLPTIPYYEETAREWRKGPDELRRHFDATRTSMLGVFIEKNIAAIGGIYALFALWLLRKPQYRDDGWEHLGVLCFGFMAFVVWFIIVSWVGTAGSEMRHAHGGTFAVQRGDASWLIKLFTGLIHPLLMIALGLSIWIGIPLYLLVLLFILPSIVFVIVRLLVRLPVLTYHYLHYLTVPHPAELVYKNGMAEGVPLPELARDVARAMNIHDLNIYKRPPPAWKSRNQKKRIEDAEKLLHAGRAFMQEFEKCVLQDARLHDD